MSVETLPKRADFLRVARGLKHVSPAFVLQATPRQGAGDTIRIGYTCSKKVGNAVARNRAKRRLRAVTRSAEAASLFRPGWDYVLIGRREKTATRNFAILSQDLSKALQRIHGEDV